VLKNWRVLTLVIVWIILGAVNLLSAGMTAYIAPALAEYPPSLPLPVLAGVYGLWGVIFFAAAALAWRRKSTGGALGLALVYQVVLWAVKLIGYRSEYARSLWPRDLLLTLIFLALIAVLAGYTRLFKMKA